MRRVIAALLLCVSFGVVSCATPDYAAPALSPEVTAQKQMELQRKAIDVQMTRRARLYDLAWPVLAANTEICPETRKSIGIVMADLEAFSNYVGGLTEEQLVSLGYQDNLRIIHVMAGSPAETAGLEAGMVIRAINEAAVDEGEAAQAMNAVGAAVKKDGAVTLGFQNAEVEVEGAEVCQATIKLSTSSGLNATALGDEIVMYAGLMRALDDDEVQFVLAHELAHVALRHTRKYSRNAAVSGGVLYGPVLYAAGSLADRALKIAGVKRKGSLANRAVAVTAPYSKHFEAEADYVGLYMLARAGGSIEEVASVFELFATESPGSTWLEYTHPITPDRVAAVELTIEEIQQKQENGLPLVPELRE